MTRAYNFSAGPATLPLEVLEEVKADLPDYAGTGMSIIESSHRGKAYSAVHDETIANFKSLLDLSDDYAVVFIQGGASLQFAMAPTNLLGDGQTADYTNSGAWAAKAIKEAKLLGSVNIAADTSGEEPARMPLMEELNLTPGAAYLHVTSNETIAGTQWKAFPETAAPLVADMSSDILSRPIDASKFGLIYAGAQKNLGPSGTALVIIRKDLAERVSTGVSTMLKYNTYIEKDSRFNTPSTFSIYVMMLVTRWLKKEGLENVFKRNAEKAAKIYDTIDGSDFFRGTAAKEHRSDMNVTFRLPDEELEASFIDEADKENLKGLKGHRSVGGIRASIYNSFPMEGIDALIAFMKEFEKTHG